MRKSILFIPIALAALACSDQPTATTNNDTPSYRAAQGDRSEMQVLLSWPAVPPDQAYPFAFIPCINGGAGETVLYWGPPGDYIGKVVETSSGNTLWNGYWVDRGDGIEHYIGVISGDEWTLPPYELAGKTKYHWNENGNMLVGEALPLVLTNTRTGEQVRVMMQWYYHFHDGVTVGNERNGEVIGCHMLPH